MLGSRLLATQWLIGGGRFHNSGGIYIGSCTLGLSAREGGDGIRELHAEGVDFLPTILFKGYTTSAKLSTG